MYDLISRKAFITEQLQITRVTETERQEGYWQGRDDTIADLLDFPTIEAEPVRHGRWEWGLNSMNQYGAWCSECKCGWEDKGDDFDRIQGLVIAHKYCPNCGATMDGGSDE